MALFAMVAKEGSFTAVAKQQSMALSAVSAAVSQLEEGLGVRLLHRTTRSLRLTEAGSAFYQRCEAMLLEANTANEELHQLHNELAGSITIAAAHLEAETWLFPALQPLLQQHPKLVPHLVISNDFVNLIQQGIDIAIRSTGDLSDSGLVARALTPEQHDVLVASPEYLKRNTPVRSAQDLAEQKIVAFSLFAQSQSIPCFDPQGAEHQIQMQLGAKANTLGACKQLCLMHLGMARLPLSAVEAELKVGSLQLVLANHQFPTYKTYAVTVRRTLHTAKINATIQTLQDFFSNKQ